MKLIFLATLLLAAFALPEEDRVQTLVNMTTFDDYGLFSGYLDIAGGKHLHYVFLESQNDPANDPLVVWFNGGPGCSSVLAWAAEHGPYVMPDGQDDFVENPYSWNNEANVIYIESPAGVGYSYTDEEKPKYNDTTSAEDNYKAIKTWFSKFPEYKTNEFFISGESYAGIYVPYLAH